MPWPDTASDWVGDLPIWGRWCDAGGSPDGGLDVRTVAAFPTRCLVVGGVVIGLLGAGWFVLSHFVMDTAAPDAIGEALGVMLGVLVLVSVVGAFRQGETTDKPPDISPRGPASLSQRNVPGSIVTRWCGEADATTERDRAEPSGEGISAAVKLWTSSRRRHPGDLVPLRLADPRPACARRGRRIGRHRLRPRHRRLPDRRARGTAITVTRVPVEAIAMVSRPRASPT